MTLQPSKLEVPPFGIIKFNLNQQIILEYHGVLVIKDFMTLIIVIKPDPKNIYALGTHEQRIVEKYTAKRNPKSMN